MLSQNPVDLLIQHTLGSALLVCNVPMGTGYAWRFINRLNVESAAEIAAAGVQPYVAYTGPLGPAPAARNGNAIPVSLPVTSNAIHDVFRTLKFIRRHRIRLICLVDQPLIRPLYFIWRLFGVRCVLVHDHTSGHRDLPTRLHRSLKRILWRVPGLHADIVAGVSEYVLDRLRAVGGAPANRLFLVTNGVEVATLVEMNRTARSPLCVVAIARATPEKGIDVLLRAWKRVLDEWTLDLPRPELLYAGDGPALAHLRALVLDLDLKDSVKLLGYQEDVDSLLREADVCVVPSVWAEAFCLVAAEAMARAVPVIGTNLGALPEVLGVPIPGRIVRPADPLALSAAIKDLLSIEPEERRRLGRIGYDRASTRLTYQSAAHAQRRLVRRCLDMAFR